MNRKKTVTCAAAITVLVGGLGFASGAMATPASPPPLNTTRTPSEPGTLAGSLAGPTKTAQDGIELKTKKATKVTTFELTYPVGSYSGWHTHPGIVIAVVRSGSVKRKTACRTEVFKVGDSFTEVGAHNVSNPQNQAGNAVPAVLEITRIYPSKLTSTRVDVPVAPVCS